MKKEYTTRDGREVEFDGIDGDVGEGAWILGSVYVDDGTDVPCNVLDQLTDDYQEDIDELFFQKQVMRAESYYEGDR